ncbi:hypothetical protein MJH12_05470 [bacterium]|nr:hypothetical protein [bacterium]
MKILFFILGFLLFTKLVFCNDSSIYKDQEHQFSIQKASKDQTFLFHDQIQQIHKDALIGIINEKEDFYSFVLIQNHQTSNLREYSQKLIKELSVNDIILQNYRDYKHQGYSALSFNLSGILDSHQVHYEINLIQKQNKVYQLFSILIDQAQSLKKFSSFKPRLILGETQDIAKRKRVISKDWLINKEVYFNQSNGFFVNLEEDDYKKVSCEAGIICLENTVNKQVILFQAYSTSANVIDQFLNHFPKEVRKQEFLTKKKENRIYLMKNGTNKVFYHLFVKSSDDKQILIIAKSKSYLDHHHFDQVIQKRFGWISDRAQSQLEKFIKKNPKKLLIQDRFQSFFKNQYRNFKAGLEINFPKKENIYFEITNGIEEHIYSEFYLENLSRNYSIEGQVQKFNSHKNELQLHQEILTQITLGQIKTFETKEYLASYYTRIDLDQVPFYVLTRKHYNSLLYIIYHGSENEFMDLLKHFHYLELDEVAINKTHYKNHKLQFSIVKQDFLIEEMDSGREGLLQVQIKNKFQNTLMYIGNREQFNKKKLLKIFGDDFKIFGLNEISSAQKSYLGHDYDHDQYRIHYPHESLRLLQQTLHRGNLVFSMITIGNQNILEQSFIHQHQLNLNNTLSH